MLPLESRSPLVALYREHSEIHVYGLADLEASYWNRSQWWLRGSAAVGLVGLPGGLPPIVYAISPADQAGTISLLHDLDRRLPDRYVFTGPVGTSESLAPKRTSLWSAPHVKMVVRLVASPAADVSVVPLSVADVGAYQDLLDTDPEAGDFFHQGLLESNHYVGIWDPTNETPSAPRLAAGAGVHVWSREFSVCALGNVATRPPQRRRGLATACVAALTCQLLDIYDSVGLNVKTTNAPARAVYQRLGFHDVHAYEEGELVRGVTASG